ncbi:FXYD domain-containing ion transport regulator 5-like isoform X1 [Varanus komodoensis]|uniref:FXYD domain-containing ion transport regulator 5-like isoform X1 n=1 Tax=Varanus komodoensis TaxID=61221 RepID=UPI001CF7731A|nr:FXYD domain-containing ion transport regulator 5-like isoform X1 [Varanus komodoensis]
MTVRPSLCSWMPRMPHERSCGASAMKLFLLLFLVSLTITVDAQGTSAPATEQLEETRNTQQEPTWVSITIDPSTAWVSEDVSQEYGTTEQITTEEAISSAAVTTAETLNSTIVKFTSTAGVTSAQQRSVDQERRTGVEKSEDEDDAFHYDYYSLRKWGLVAAAVLFILGILILTCGKHGKFPRCRGKKQTRTYNVAQA